MSENLIPATQLAEYVYCSRAWHLKQRGVPVSKETRVIQAQANAWHEVQGRSLTTGHSYRWAGYAAGLLAVVLFIFCWLGWSR
jgi:hypothetical protein